MRRDEIIKSVEELSPILESITRSFEALFDGKVSERDVVIGALELRETFTRIKLSASKNTLEMMSILGLGTLGDSETWAEIVNTGPPAATSLRRKVSDATRALWLLKHTLTQGHAYELMKSIESDHSNKIGLLELIILEDDDNPSTPERLTTAISSIDDLYAAVTALSGEPSKLAVIACDSGSDKSFDFTGAAAALAHVKEILLALWDRVVYFRKNQQSRTFELIAQGLPILDQIEQRKESGVIEPETAELLKRQVLAGCTKFLDSGCTIPEINADVNLNPRELLTPEPKLLEAKNLLP